jgi:NitT/TauT family transport system substrate-binding protein
MLERQTVRIGVLVSLLLVLLSFQPATAGQKLTKLTVGYSAIAIEQLPAWVAKETGIFVKNGLDTDLVYFPAGTTAIMALLSGGTAISESAGPETANAFLGGSDAVFIAAGRVTLAFWLVTRKDIKAPEQLKGGSVSISRFGSVSDFVARFAAQKLGLTPGKDVAIVQLGGSTERLTAVETGRNEATVLPSPSVFIAQRRGLNVMVDVSEAGLPFQYTGAVTTRKYIRENPEIVRSYVKSHLEAVHLMKSDKSTGMRVLAKYFAQYKDRESLEKGYDDYITETSLPRKQYPTLPGIKTVLDYLAEREPKAKTIKPEDLVDDRFIKELDQSGFIDGLYKK